MKRTRRKNLLRNIKGSLNRFLSILFIVALGSGFMAGLAATSPDMYDSADKYLDDYGLYDIDIKSTLGFSEADVSAVSGLEFADTVMPARVVDMILTAPGEKNYTGRVFSFLDEAGKSPLNGLRLTQGRLPSAPGECVIQETMGRYSDGHIEIGETLTISAENTNYADLQKTVKQTVLTIVGIAESPMCIGISAEASTVGNGRIALDVYVSEEYFGFEYYTDIYLTVKDSRDLNTFSDGYESLISEKTGILRSLGEERSEIRAEELKNEAKDQLQSLRDYADTISGVTETATILGEDTVIRLGQTAAVTRLLSEVSPEIAAELTKTREAVTETLKNTDPNRGKQLAEAFEKYISEAEKAVSDIGTGSWLIRTRSDASGYSSYDGNVGKVAALSKIFPVFFFMVALLVALTTMTRLVEENRGQIGTLKALGFSNGQILGEYMLYSLLSSALGCALGFAVGFRLFPKAISSAYSMMYILPATETPFRLSIALWVAPVTVVSILLATLWACWGEFRACPAQLMQPKAPAAGKRIWLEHIPFVWKRLSFTHKVTCRNLFRYKKRFFMTIIGVAGCSALLLTGFGLKDSINDIVDKQFGQVYRYDLTVMTESRENAEDDEKLQSVLNNGSIISGSLVYSSENGKIITDKGEESVAVNVPADITAFPGFISLSNRKTGENIPFPEDGAVLTEKLCETLSVSVGDTVTVESADGVRGKVRVTGITENYIASGAYISENTYRKIFGETPAFSTILCRVADGADIDGVITDLMTADSVVYVNAARSLKDSFNDSIKSIDGVILVLILAAGLLCMVVLYNLTNVNICERRKELATIRVLGFHKREVERYIFRETDTLSFLGSVVGLFVGIWLHGFVVRTVEIDQVMFGRSIYPQSFAYALIISMVFTLLVNLVMRRRIRSVDMVEAMKAND